MIFINLPVSDLQRSMQFYTILGFTNNPQFTDDTAACMVYSESIFVMLLTHDKFKMFTTKSIADTKTSASVICSLGVESVAAVNKFVENALIAGGSEPMPAQDMGFMLQRSVEDPDGNLWEVAYMDMSKLPEEV